VNGVSDLFVPTIQPPDTPAIAGSLWFHVRGNHVWVAEAAILESEDPLFVGMLGTTACWAVEVAHDAPDPDDAYAERFARAHRPIMAGGRALRDD